MGAEMNIAKIQITLVTTICMLAVTTTTSAAFFKTSLSQYPATIRSKGVNHTFTVPAKIAVKCQVELQGNAQNIGPEGSSQLTQRPVYNQCKGKLAGGAEVGVTVQVNRCRYNFHQAKGATEGTASVECPGANRIEFEVTGCNIRINIQLNIRKIAYTVEGVPKRVNIKAKATGIAYKASGCGEFIKAGEHADGEYEGETKTESEYHGIEEGFEVV
jgi:hypothetical protein